MVKHHVMRGAQHQIWPLRTSGLWITDKADYVRILSDARLKIDQYQLNKFGSIIWRLCDGTRTPAQIAREIKNLCSTPIPRDEIILDDVMKFLYSLRDLGLVKWTENEKIDVLLVVPPAPAVYDKDAVKVAEYSAPPLGLCYIAASLREQHFRVAILDLHQRAGLPEDVVSACRMYNPDIVGITASTPSYPNANRTARFVKAWRDNCITVIGGPHATTASEECAMSGAFDFVCLGEGEQGMADLANAIIKGSSNPNKIAGFCFLNSEGQFIRNKQRPRLRNLDKLPLPARDLLDIETYYQKGAMISSRGCPIGCNFCTCAAIVGRSYRAHSIDYVLYEMKHIIDTYECRHFDFHDDVFNLKQDRVFEFCAALNKKCMNVEWGCFCRAAQMTQALANEMAEAGCRVIQFGVESGNASVLRSLNKQTSLAQIEAAVCAAAKAGIEQIVCGFIIGYATDTAQTICDTINFGLRLRGLGATRLTLSLLTPYPGTEVYRHREQLGIKLISDDWEQYTFSRVVMETAQLHREELRELYTKGIIQFLEATKR